LNSRRDEFGVNSACRVAALLNIVSVCNADQLLSGVRCGQFHASHAAYKDAGMWQHEHRREKAITVSMLSLFNFCISILHV